MQSLAERLCDGERAHRVNERERERDFTYFDEDIVFLSHSTLLELKVFSIWNLIVWSPTPLDRSLILHEAALTVVLFSFFIDWMDDIRCYEVDGSLQMKWTILELLMPSHSILTVLLTVITSASHIVSVRTLIPHRGGHLIWADLICFGLVLFDFSTTNRGQNRRSQNGLNTSNRAAKQAKRRSN